MQTEDVKNKYNKDISGKFNNEYEHERWFKNDIQKAGYDMTLSAIKTHALTRGFATCFELGPGHGTWTSELLAYQPDASYDLLDISSSMLDLVRKRFIDKNNIAYIESDFLQYEITRQYDFFFSSRVIEYIPEKSVLVKKIVQMIKPGGRGFIITKTPKYLRKKILGIEIPEFHSGQIEPRDLERLFKENGCQKIEIYPVTFSWPFWRSVKMNMRLYEKFGNKQLNCISQFFSESYCVCFEKKI